MWLSSDTPQLLTQNDLAALRDDMARVHAQLEQQQALLLSFAEARDGEFYRQNQSANDHHDEALDLRKVDK